MTGCLEYSLSLITLALAYDFAVCSDALENLYLQRGPVLDRNQRLTVLKNQVFRSC
jgi:hypothetical protein